MGEPEASAMMRADNRRLKGDLAKSRQMFGRTFGKIGGGIKKKLSGALGSLAGIAGGIGIMSIGKSVLDFEETLTRLGIQAGTSAEDLDKFRTETIALSRSTGISRGELIGATNALVNLTGSAGFAQDKLAVLANANLATGASMEDLAGLAFSLDNAFKLKNADELQAGLSAIVTAGKDGAIPLDQMAGVLQSVSASFKDIGGIGVQGAGDLAAALQVLRAGGFSSASEAGTGLQAVITGLTKKSDLLGKKGIKVFNKDGSFRGMRAILDDFEKADLTIKELTDTIGRVEGAKGIKALAGKEGRRNFEKLAAAAQLATDAVAKDAEKFRNSSAGKLKVATNNIKETLAAVFTPDRIRDFVALMEKLAGAAGFVVDHAKAFAAAWAGIKIAGFASSMLGIVGGLKEATGAAAGLKGSLGKAGALGAALALGFAIGTILDDLTDASGKLSDLAVDVFGDTKSYSDNAFLRQTSTRVREDQAGAKQGQLDPVQALNNARRLLNSAKNSGVLSESGGISRRNAAKATSSDSLSPMENARIATGGNTEAGAKLVSAIEAAQRLVQSAEAQRAKGLDVRIMIDNQGNITATGNERAQGAE